jgi:sulfur carrier protein
VKLTINGEPRELPEDTTVLGLLEALKISPQRVAVEVNAQLVRRARHGEHRLQDGDTIEVVTFVGGG